MSMVKGIYYDGKSAARHPVSVEVTGAELRVVGEGLDITCAVSEVKIPPPLAGVRPSLRLPGGAVCQFATDNALRQLLGEKGGGRFWSMVSRWERSLPLALTALVLTIAIVALFIAIIIPAVVGRVALAVTPAAEEGLGRETMAQLDRFYLKPSHLPIARKVELIALLKKMSIQFADGRKYRLELRDGGAIGANAFALPGGTIVMTDAMVALAKNDNELAGVLAHEAGHVRRRHALRHLLQSSGAGIVIAAVTGDITSITSLAATLPATLINAGYSRDFEYEADDAAVAYLKKEGIPPKVYADILGRLDSNHGKSHAPPVDVHIFDSHPTTPDRIKRVISAQ